MTDHGEAPRTTPTQFARELALAHATRAPQKASEEVEVTRNAKGDWQFTISGVAGEDETLSAVALRVLSVAVEIDTKMPLSRAQHFGREYLPNEKDAVKRAKQ